MEDTPAISLVVLVLCPALAPVAHRADCTFRHLFLPPRPGMPGDWSGAVTDLDQIRQGFPGVLFHACLLSELRHGTDNPVPTTNPKPRGAHPYGRT
ncbi:hypothetical protein HII36_44280 [Nonomuraea sp. NN258]|uniref:hypothetical protein n=1 Tax=Nonomuraea antri TaxID=2730852 RepID=UPI0015696F3A|nr:hypothetical protein [Nonomuraea antri]NRQ38795.1 hypothetical protein [Nonomuraea antri]